MNARRGFTLFELILAIALSATLLALIGTAVNLYLLRVDAGRTRVEEAQLARSILSIIAADVRATTTYQTQDISAIARLAAQSTPFDTDSITESGTFGGSLLGSPGSTGSVGAAGISGGSDANSSLSSASEGLARSTSAVPGLNGLTGELMLDVARLPRLDELFPTLPGQASTVAASAVAANSPQPSDLKTIRYFIRPGAAIDPSDVAATAIGTPESRNSVGGLVRQTINWAVRQSAEQAANSQLLRSGQALLAPEVTHIQFRYFDGTTAYDQWDMQEQAALPTAVEVRIWLDPDGGAANRSATAAPSATDHMYLATIELPLAQSTGAASESTDDSTQQDASDTGEEESSAGFGGTP